MVFIYIWTEYSQNFDVKLDISVRTLVCINKALAA